MTDTHRYERRGGPLVSILTPSYNQARWLGACLDSVATQSYPHVEHVIFDGGSTDGSLDILARAGHRVWWRSEPDRGQAHAVNKAFAASSGEIIGWVNSDDGYFHRSALEEVVSCFEAHPTIDVVYGHAALVNASGRVLHTLWVPRFHPQLLRVWNFLVQPSVFLRRQSLGDKLLDEEFHSTMDRELWLRLAMNSRYFRLDSVLAIDRHYPARKSLAREDLARDDVRRLVQRYEIPDPSRVKAPVKAMKVVARCAGVRLIPYLARKEMAFCGALDSGWKVMSRQVGRRRGSMPAE